MSHQSSADGLFLRKLVRFFVGLVAVFVALGVGVYYALQGTVGLGYLVLFFVVAFGIPAGVILVFKDRSSNGGGGA